MGLTPQHCLSLSLGIKPLCPGLGLVVEACCLGHNSAFLYQSLSLKCDWDTVDFFNMLIHTD